MLTVCLRLQADLRKKDAEVEALQAALSSSQAEAGVAQAASAGATSQLESALQQVRSLRSLVISCCTAAHCFEEQGQPFHVMCASTDCFAWNLQAKQEAASQREQVKALTEQLAKAERSQRDQAEAAEARVRDLTGAVEEAQVI